jgi:predicted RNA-binding protein with RPS1 domain
MSFPFERLDRDRGPVKGNIFVVTPYGKREFVNDDGETIVFDFDEQYQDHYVPVIESIGMTPVRADTLYSDETITGNVWCGLQEAEIVAIDLTGSNRNVMIEFAWAYLLGKKLIPLTQCRSDMPTDLPGLRYIHYSPLVKDQARAEAELAKQLKVLADEQGGERRLVPLETSTIRPVTARVVSTAHEHVVVEAEKGQFGVLGTADVEWGRLISDMAHRFSVGDVLNGAFETTDGYTRYTLLAGQNNPWHAIAAEFPPGRTFTGKVVNLIDNVGAFIRVGHGVNGLVPTSSLQACGPVDIGTELNVGVARLDVQARRILLRPITGNGAGGGAGRPAGLRPVTASADVTGDLPRVGDRVDAEVCRVAPEAGRSGGYVLVMLPGMLRPAMLHCTQMLNDLREDLNNGELQAGDLVYVEVIKVDARLGKVQVRDLGEPPAEEGIAA